MSTFLTQGGLYANSSISNNKKASSSLQVPKVSADEQTLQSALLYAPFVKP